MSESIRKAIEEIHRKRLELEQRTKETCVITALLGAGGKGLEKRKEIDKKLEEEGIICLIPEDDFAPDVAPSLTEEALFKQADVDLVFVNVASWGAATEFGQMANIDQIAPKLRVLVPSHHHPLCGSSKSYLTDLYLTHMTKHGHVYAYGENRNSSCPTPERIVVTSAKRFKMMKALSKI